MFGYISINKSEMKFKDYDIYHSYYCGLCRRLKELFGRSAQLTLTFDMTFLIVLLTSLYEPEEKLETVRCIAHPLEKHPARMNEFTSYAAAMNLIFSYYKCKDDWMDERKLKSRLASILLTPKMKTLKERYAGKMSATASRLQRLSDLEQQQEENLDVMSGIFGETMAELFACRQDEWEAALRRMGFFLGKFIYLMDAYEDVEKDLKTGAYNPLKKEFKENPDFAGSCKTLLTMMMAECSREFEKLPLVLYTEILRNVLYSGVWSRYTIITAKRQEKQGYDSQGADQ